MMDDVLDDEEIETFRATLAWHLPGGKAVANAAGYECDAVAYALKRIAREKRERANVSSRKAENGVYEVLLDGRKIGEVRRQGRKWVAVDGAGNVWGEDLGWETRAQAGECLLRQFA